MISRYFGIRGKLLGDGDAAIVVLVVVLKLSLAQTFERNPVQRQLFQDLLRTDRVGVVIGDDIA